MTNSIEIEKLNSNSIRIQTSNCQIKIESFRACIARSVSCDTIYEISDTADTTDIFCSSLLPAITHRFNGH